MSCTIAFSRGRPRILFIAAIAMIASQLSGMQQQPAPPPQQPEQNSAVSQSGLLPMFAIDLQLDPAWVDGSAFPSSSAKYPNNGVSDALQQAWTCLSRVALT